MSRARGGAEQAILGGRFLLVLFHINENEYTLAPVTEFKDVGRFSPSIPFQRNVTVLGRPTCFECFRPESHCVCNFIEPFEAHCNLLLLQHPHERRKYYSTARLLRQAIRNCRVIRGIEHQASFLTQLLAGQQLYLLYPARGALDCTRITLDRSSTVIVLDGTWREAQKILFRNEFLQRIPCLTFPAQLKSTYRIRKQPRDGCLSSIESVGHLLKSTAPLGKAESLVPAYDSLFSGFERMIKQQLSYWPERK